MLTKETFYWESLYNNLYSMLSKERDLVSDTIGWNNSYTGEAIPNEEILDWIERTSNLILSLKPKRVLDIGCGTGLLLSRIAQHCEDYWGTDISAYAIDYLEGLKQQNTEFKHIKLLKKKADDFEDIKTNYFDVIILNSVIQYFPNIQYLNTVLRHAVHNIKKGGQIFIGDVRNLRLQNTYHGSVEVFKSADDASKKEVESNIQLRIKQERELVVDPRFFKSIKNEINSIKHVQIQPKGGYYNNELTKFRYDVLLYINKEINVKTISYWVDWRKEKISLKKIKQYLVDHNPSLYALRRVSNFRLQEDYAILDWFKKAEKQSTVKELRSYILSQNFDGIDIEDLKQLAEMNGYNIEISWYNAYEDGGYDVVFIKKKNIVIQPHLLIDFSDIQDVKYQEQLYANNPFQEDHNMGKEISGKSTFRNTFLEVEKHNFRLMINEIAKIRLFAQAANLTVNSILQGALAIVLRIYTGQNDAVFKYQDLENLVNSVSVRVRIFSKIKIKYFLTNLYKDMLKVNEYNSKVYSLFTYQDGKEYPLSVVISPGKELRISLNYQSKYLSKQIIARFEDHFREVLRCMAENPEMVIGDINILSAAERRKVLIEWNDTTVDYSRDKCIQELFEEQVEKTPDLIAVVCGEAKISYREINRRANQLAHYLRGCGVGPEVLVGIGMERSQEMIIAILGILKAGGGYVPLDLSYPQERLKYMLEDSKASVLLTQSYVRDKFNSYKGKLIEIDTNKDIAGEKDNNPQNNKESSDNVAYVIYTSGSTGRPKGVLVKQNSLVSSTQARCRYYKDITSFMLISSIAFDSSVAGIFSTLLEGGELVLFESKEFDVELLTSLIRKNKVSHMLCTPSAYYSLMEYGKKENIFGAVKNVIVAGEACSKGLINRHFNRINYPRLYNEYGPTECTVWATVQEIKNNDKFVIKIGRPIKNVRIYILDECLNPVPEGVLGEIYIGGEGVARGYIGRSDLTAEKFIANPYASEDDVKQAKDLRLYKTGDIGRYLADGEIEFIGRQDDQVKIRGYRIELGEIESVLSLQDLVSQVVIVVSGEEEHKKIVAYIVPQEEERQRLEVRTTTDSIKVLGGDKVAIYVEELRSHLLNFVPEYMIPAFFIFIESLPLTANGKLDKKALPGVDTSIVGEEYIAPRDNIEEELCSIWKEVLKLEKVSINNNFFKIGGDSIIAILLIMQAKKRSIELNIQDIFANPTISTLGLLVKKNRKCVSSEQNLIISVFCLAPIQKRFFEQDITSSYQTIFLKPKNRIRESLFKKVMKELINHHDMLRAKFNFNGNVWKQEILIKGNYSYIYEDLSVVSDDILQQEIKNRSKEVYKNLDIYKGKLVAIIFYDFGKDRGQNILIVIHSLVIDKFSFQILIEDIESSYKQVLHGKKLQFLPKTYSYTNWAQILKSSLRIKEANKEIEYWKKIEADVQKLSRSSNKIVNYAKKRIVKKLTEEETSILKELSIAYKTEIKEILLTSLVLTTGDCKGEYNIAIDLEVDGRKNGLENLDVSRTVGCFSNIFPVFLKIHDENDIERCVKEITEIIRTIPNDGANYGTLRNIKSVLPGEQVDTIFSYLGDSLATGDGEEKIFCYEYGVDNTVINSNYKLAINSWIEKGRLTIWSDYSTKYFSVDNIKRFLNVLVERLRRIISYYLQNKIDGYAYSAFNFVEFDQDIIDELSEIMNKK